MTDAHFFQHYQANDAAVRAELQAGLQDQPAHIAPKFFYDALGSRLFDAITELPEYYPTRTEAEIFASHGKAMGHCLPAGAVMVDLGAGCCSKAARLFPVLQPAAYVAVDISVDYLRGTLSRLQAQHPQRPMLGLGLDFSQALQLPPQAQEWLASQALAQAPRCVFYPGSSIGNFTPEEALRLLRQAHAVCKEGGAGGGLLIGVDLVKEAPLLEAAYDDALGVTAAFNRNILRHANALLGTDFQPAQWDHVAEFDVAQSRVAMYLAARQSQTVRWPGGVRHFAAGERMHTENAFKWTTARFSALLAQAGFGSGQHWRDARGWFSVFWAPA